MGISFKERTEAFDFNVALTEWDTKRLRSEIRKEVTADDVPIPKFQDLSLKQGEKLHLKLKPVNNSSDLNTEEEKKVKVSVNIISSKSENHALAPPPSSGKRRIIEREKNNFGTVS